MDENKTNRLRIIGHRGAPMEAPENTMASFARAIESGAYAVEADLRRTADGRVVVIHDKTLNRTTDERGRVDSLTEDKLLKLDAGSSFGRKFAGEKIPLLDTLLAWAAANGTKLFLELKDAEIEEFVVRRLAAHDMNANVTIVSLSLDSLARVRDLEPKIALAPILVSANKMNPKVIALKPECVFLWAGPLMTSGVVSSLKKMNISVATWIVDSKPLLEKMIKRGVDAVITNETAIISGYVNDLEKA